MDLQLNTSSLGNDIDVPEHERAEEVVDEPEEVEINICSRCNISIDEGKHGCFDIDSCGHCVCVKCRFEESVPCLVCKTQTTTENCLEKHGQLATSNQNVKYSKRKAFNTDHIVDVEASATGASREQMCTVCQRVFKKSNARYHYACASGDKPFSCDECGRKFVKKTHWQIHLNNHFGIKPFKCMHPKCNASFSQKDKLIRHMKIHNKEKKEMHQCSICSKSYTSKDILKAHLKKVHTSEKPFQCELCPRSYKYSKSLKIHLMEKHQAKKLYMCEVCGKKYTLAAQLRIHKRSHIPYHRRAHKCACGCRFMTRRDKLRHQLIHASTSKDFECSICNTTFGRKDNLERHMKNFHQDTYPTTLNKKIKPSCKRLSINTKTNCKNNNNRKIDNSVKDSSKPNSKKKKASKNKSSTHASVDVVKSVGKVDVVDLSIGKDLKSREKDIDIPISKNSKSSSPLQLQDRPSVIKSVPKLLPYRVLQTQTEKMLPESGKNSGNPQNITLNQENKTVNKQAQKTKVKKDDSYNRCFRIIRHTSAIQNQSRPAANNSFKGNLVNNIHPSFRLSNNHTNSNSLQKNSKPQDLPQTLGSDTQINVETKHVLYNFSSSTTQINGRIVEITNSNFPGGPVLPVTVQENMDRSQDNGFSATYVPINENNDASYTPYFENDCFRETVNNNYEDFDINFQYDNVSFHNYSEASLSSASKTGKFIETKIIKHL